MELAIDTSTATAGVAIAREGQALAELTWRAGRDHTKQLLSAIDYLLKRHGLSQHDLTAIVVAVGPGSFSGLRVGVSAAKGLAVGLGVPLAGIGTLAVEAHPFAPLGLPVRPVLDAGRGELAAACFRWRDSELEESEPPSMMMLDELCAAIRERTVFCGEHLPAVQAALAERLGANAVFPPPSALLRRPGHLAELGWRRLSLGKADDPATLQPLYLRAPSITRPRPAQPVRKGNDPRF